ncbi:MoaD family protein [Halodesulfurarchaeum formicicum]|uniref:MoaD family protein n=1 Tax=Halodesulfurarchaeum formicicum TaxID=1873524 RepID=A0A1D8S6Y6_9EURY|nr:ubiquitin-like small modifier protein 1 [Halodesulfurarchaeum formicicum]AOW81120.1 MoaD family protein [Halodesulfurarchaeum formicicum]APE96462.1 MoaD family protein [Halodesulfurarchaeum formicicum]
MELEIRLFATFREAVGQKTITRTFEAPVTVGAVLKSLEAEFPDLEGEILDEDGLQPQLNVLKNGREISYLDGLEEGLEEGDRLSVFPPVAGG